MTDTLDVTYRKIAKMLCSALPVEGEEFGYMVTNTLEVIKAMPAEDKNALKAAYIFSRKVPREEREDMFQELALALLEARTKDERLAYTIARCDWRNWWEKFKTREHYLAGSLNRTVSNGEGGEVEFGELLVGEVEFERKMQGKIDGEALYKQLPGWVQRLVSKRLAGYPIKGGDRMMMDKWIAQRPLILAEYQS